MSELNLTTDEARVSYGIGRQLGDQLRENPVPGMTLDAVLAACPMRSQVSTAGFPARRCRPASR